MNTVGPQDGSGRMPLSLMCEVEHPSQGEAEVDVMLPFHLYQSCVQTLFYMSCSGLRNHSLRPIKNHEQHLLADIIRAV